MRSRLDRGILIPIFRDSVWIFQVFNHVIAKSVASKRTRETIPKIDTRLGGINPKIEFRTRWNSPLCHKPDNMSAKSLDHGSRETLTMPGIYLSDVDFPHIQAEILLEWVSQSL